MIALIGIILLIGIVKKNGIMIVDFALEAQRKEGKPAPRSNLPGVPAALSADHDDHDGGVARRLAVWRLGTGTGSELRRPLGIAMVGGLLLSQLLTSLHHPGDLSCLRASRGADGKGAGRRRISGAGRFARFMSFSETFIRRPVATTLLTVAIALAGAVAFRMLPVAPLPEVDFPTIQVSGALPGASPETMASSVATPLERQFGRIAALTELTSTSALGATNIVLQFDLDRNIDAAARDVQAAINAARSQLPANLPSNPTYKKVNPADAPILILALTSNTLRRGLIYDAADSILAQKLSQIQGVGQVSVGGSALPGVRVELNSSALNNYGIGLEQVRNTLSNANANRPKGEVADQTSSWSLSATDQLLSADQYRPLIVAYNNGAAVRLSDVADVIDSVEDVRNAGMVDGTPSVLIIIFRAPGANIIDTVDRVLADLPQLQASISPAIKMSVVLDRTTTIRASVNDVELTLLISISLVILVVFLFLRNLRATVIPGVVVPISLIGTFGVMYLCGYSLDNLSLMALTISTGFVVDDAIVVIENISRYREQGMAPFEAAVRGAREIGFTVVSISVSLVAVFIPILLMGGIVGRLFREFAVTLSVAVGVSMVSLADHDADDVRQAAAARSGGDARKVLSGRVREFSTARWQYTLSAFRGCSGTRA